MDEKSTDEILEETLTEMTDKMADLIEEAKKAVEFKKMKEMFTLEAPSTEMFIEMAQINPKLSKSIKRPIYIGVPQGREGPIPHAHVYHNSSLNKKECSFIRLDIPEYSPHHDKIPLPRELEKSFISVLREEWPKYNITEKDGTTRAATGYEAAMDMWIDSNGLADNIVLNIDEETGVWIMPDYYELFSGDTDMESGITED